MTYRPVFLYCFPSLSQAHLFAMALEAWITKPTEDMKKKKKVEKLVFFPLHSSSSDNNKAELRLRSWSDNS